MKKFVGGLPITKSNLHQLITQIELNINNILTPYDKNHLITDFTNNQSYSDSGKSKLVEQYTNTHSNNKTPYYFTKSNSDEYFIILANAHNIDAFTLNNTSKTPQLTKIATSNIKLYELYTDYGLLIEKIETNVDYRANGIGSELLTFIENYAHAIGCTEVSLNSRRNLVETIKPIPLKTKCGLASINIKKGDKYLTDTNEQFYLNNGYIHLFDDQAKVNENDNYKTLHLSTNLHVEMIKLQIDEKSKYIKSINSVCLPTLTHAKFIEQLKYTTQSNTSIITQNNFKQKHKEFLEKTKEVCLTPLHK